MPQALLDSAKRAWHPKPVELAGLAQFTTPYHDMTVNAYLAWDANTNEAVAFDTGADAEPLLEFVRSRKLTLKLILLTHSHGDHVLDLPRLQEETGAAAFISEREPVSGARKASRKAKLFRSADCASTPAEPPGIRWAGPPM